MGEYNGKERRSEHTCSYGKQIKEIHDAILGTFDKKGMRTIQEEHEVFIKGVKKRQWLYFTVVFGGAVTLCFKWVYDCICTLISRG